MQSRCAASGCLSGISDFQALFRFPRDPNRSQQWVEWSQRPELSQQPVEQLFRYYRLCGKHFQASAFNSDAPGSVLKADAIPSMFEAPGPVKGGKDTPQENETEKRGRKRMKKAPAEPVPEAVPTVPEEDEEGDYLKTLLEAVLLLGEQSIPPLAPSSGNDDGCKSCNFQALLEYRLNCGDDVLKKRFDSSKQNCFSSQLDSLAAACERNVRRKVVEGVKQSGFFSLITDEPLQVAGEWCLPVFVLYLDQSNSRQERFVGFLPLDGDGDEDALPEKLLCEITDGWGLDMSQCRGHAHSCSGMHSGKLQAFASAVVERYPKAVLTFRATDPLNLSLAGSMALPGVQLVLATLRRIRSFFSQSPLLQVEFEHAISIFYPDKEDKAEELKRICRGDWTRGTDVFEVALEVIEALLLCVDSVHDNEDMRWNDQVTHAALEISKALTDFEFVAALVVLKHVTALVQAFGRNLRGSAADVQAAAAGLPAALQSLQEVSDNVDVYHDFFYEEAVGLAAAMEIPVRVPRSFLRRQRRGEEEEEAAPVQAADAYYKERLTVPAVKHVVGQMNALFSPSHRRALGCVSLVPDVIERNKSSQPDQDGVRAFGDDLPNADGLEAELHCWWVKWSKKGKGETFPRSLQEALRLPDLSFFPNVSAALRLVSILPTLAPEDDAPAFKRFRMFTENMADGHKSKSLALLNINYDVGLDLQAVLDSYQETQRAS